MNEIVQYLPLLDLLVIPVFMAYLRTELRLQKLEIFKKRAEVDLGYNERRRENRGT
jgi:hypothetical protein